MSTVIKGSNGNYLIHTKGASEIVLSLCTSYVDSKGKISPFTKSHNEKLIDVINSLAEEGLRTLCIAYKEIKASSTDPSEWDTAPDNDMVLLAIVGIQDPLRPEVIGAIAQCKTAGITVRMVTGDNKLTATRIATDAGILEEGYEVMEGSQFRSLTDSELDLILPKLRVLARSSPSDKHRLVTRLKYHKEVVAVTGDGTK